MQHRDLEIWFRFLGLWRCSETKRAYVPTIHIRKMLYNNDFRAWGLFEGSPDESDRIGPKREEKGVSGRFWADQVPSWAVRAWPAGHNRARRLRRDHAGLLPGRGTGPTAGCPVIGRGSSHRHGFSPTVRAHRSRNRARRRWPSIRTETTRSRGATPGSR